MEASLLTLPPVLGLPQVLRATVKAVVANPRTTPDALFVLADALREAAAEAEQVAQAAVAQNMRLIAAFLSEIGEERAR